MEEFIYSLEEWIEDNLVNFVTNIIILFLWLVLTDLDVVERVL